MNYRDEQAALRLAIKKTLKAGNPEAGFLHLKKWTEKNQKRNHKEIIRIFRK